MERGPQNPNLSFDELFEEARASRPLLAEQGQKMIDALQAINPRLFEGITLEIAPIKEVEGARAKVDVDYAGDQSKIVDLVRGRVLVDKPEQVAAIRVYITEQQRLAEIPEGNPDINIVNSKDRFAKPSETNFRDINMALRLPNGHVAEFRIEDRDLTAASKPTHAPYKQAQVIDRTVRSENRAMTVDESIERQRIIDFCSEQHGQCIANKDLNSLLSPAGIERVNEIEAQRITPKSPQLIEAEAAAQTRAAANASDTPNTTGHITTPETPSTAVGTVADAMGNIGKNSGLIGGCVFGVIAGGLTLFGGGSAEAAASATYASVVPYGETQMDVARGDMGAAAQSATVETASNAASIGGMAVGAVVGQILIPIPGVGAAVGAFVGGLGAGVVVGAATDFVLDHGAEIVNTTMGAVNSVGSAIGGAVDAVGDIAGNVLNGITGFFNGNAEKIEPEATPVNTPTMRDTERFLSEVSAEQAQGLSPEMQSLYELRSDFARFWGQFNDLVEQGSLGEIMRDIQSHVGENARSSEPLLAQQDREFTQRFQSGGNLAFG